MVDQISIRSLIFNRQKLKVTSEDPIDLDPQSADLRSSIGALEPRFSMTIDDLQSSIVIENRGKTQRVNTRKLYTKAPQTHAAVLKLDQSGRSLLGQWKETFKEPTRTLLFPDLSKARSFQNLFDSTTCRREDVLFLSALFLKRGRSEWRPSPLPRW